MRYLPPSFLLFFVLSGCNVLADLGAKDVSSKLNPGSVSISGSQCSFSYNICKDEYCIDIFNELTIFELELESGEEISCVGVYREPTWIDGSKNEWLDVGKDSDPRCQEEMERLAEQD